MDLHKARYRYNKLWDRYTDSNFPNDALIKEMFKLEKEFGLKALTPKPSKEIQYKPYVKLKFKKDTRNMKRYNHLDTNFDLQGWAEVTDEREETEFEYFAERQ